MTTEEALKDKLRQRLTDHDGNIAPHDLVDIIDEAKELGISEQLIARWLPELDRSINWEQVRAEKAKETARLQQLQDEQDKRTDELKAAPEYLGALISYCMADGIVEAEELHTVFGKAKELEQSEIALAGKIKTLFDAAGFRPYPNPDLNANGLHEVLMSTNWYTEKLYQRVLQKERDAADKAEEQQSQLAQNAQAVIHSFTADKTAIKKGGYATLSWEVSGVEELNVAPFGKTNKLKSTWVVKPVETTRYVLTAGNQQREVVVAIRNSSFFKKLLTTLLLIGIVILAVKIAQYVNNRDENSSTTATDGAQLTVGKAHTSNISTDEETRIVSVMNDYLLAQKEDGTSTDGINRICDFFSYPVQPYFFEKSADRAFVYSDVLRYRSKYRPDNYSIEQDKTAISKDEPGSYTMDLYGNFSYYIRNPKVPPGFKMRYLHTRYRLNGDYKITAVYEVR